MEGRERISYILENNLEKRVKVNFLNKKGLLINIMGKSPSSNTYNFNRNLKFVHLQNFDFGDCSSFRFADETIVIFDNCHFSGPQIYFSGGYVQIINSSFDFLCGKVNLTLNGVVDFDFVSSTENDGLVGPYLCFWGVDCGNFSVKGNNNYYKFRIYADNCYLESVKNLDVFSFNANSLEIVNSDLVFAKKEVNLNEVDACGHIDVNNLVLKDVCIDGGDSILIIDCDNLSGRDYELKFNYVLGLNNVYYFNKGKKVVVWSSDKDLNGKMNFISFLKNLILRNEQLIDDKIKDELSYYDDVIMKQEAIINEEIEKLSVIKNEVIKKTDQAKKALIKKKIKDL